MYEKSFNHSLTVGSKTLLSLQYNEFCINLYNY